MEQLVNFIIRPPRAEYDPKNDLLDQEFMLKGKWYQRKDVEVENSRGETLKCSHYVPLVSPEGKSLPCVIYCHGNSGCRADASEAAIILLPLNITVFTLDFSGSGLSGGEHVSLGWNEKDDLKAVVDYLRADGDISLIGLWGRSMGAVTSLMYGAEDPSIAGMVLDSPFSDLVNLMMELVDTYKVRLPKFTVKFAIQYMRRAILKKAKFDIMELNAIKVAKLCFVPVLFGHAVDDDFIQPHHSDRIYDVYVGDKNIIKFEGDHNSPRPQFYFDSISIFFNNVLQPPQDELGDAYFGTSFDYFGKGRWDVVPEMALRDNSLATSAGPATSSTEDAIKQLRTKRPMSKMEVPSDMSSSDKQSGDQGEGSGAESKMISFELANGHPYGPLSSSIDDDEYVEYPLDNTADFPSNVEEEERMLMEAVLLSLKDLDVRNTHAEKPPLIDGVNPVSLQKGVMADISTSEQVPVQKMESDPILVINEQVSVLELPPSDTSSLSNVTRASASATTQSSSDTKLANQTSAITQSSSDTKLANQTSAIIRSLSDTRLANQTSAITQSSSDTRLANQNSAISQSSSDTELANHTKATLTVVKNPSSSNIIDGLLRRWDLKFFRGR